VVERESLASTAMEGGVAFLHTRARDKGKISRPFLVCGRSWEGIAFGGPDGRPTFLFFLMGLKYDKLHLPILGRLARSLRNPQTIAKLRAMSSPDKLRALLLREDEAARAGLLPDLPPPEYKPRLDKTLRLRALRRLGAQRRAEEEKATRPPPRARTPKAAPAASAATAAAPGPAAAEKKRPAAARKPAAADTRKPAAADTKKPAGAEKKKPAART
jgi:mannitol/fructose-specific phosphotransferase system IIA component